jgi:hypothetical protein
MNLDQVAHQMKEALDRVAARVALVDPYFQTVQAARHAYDRYKEEADTIKARERTLNDLSAPLKVLEQTQHHLMEKRKEFDQWLATQPACPDTSTLQKHSTWHWNKYIEWGKTK